LTNGRKVNTYPVPLMALDPGLSLKERSLPIPKKVLPVSVEGVPEAAARRLIRGSLVVRVWAIGHPASGQTCPLALRRVTARSRTSRIGVAAWAGATDVYPATTAPIMMLSTITTSSPGYRPARSGRPRTILLWRQVESRRPGPARTTYLIPMSSELCRTVRFSHRAGVPSETEIH
jgi:hypothetical protein